MEIKKRKGIAEFGAPAVKFKQIVSGGSGTYGLIMEDGTFCVYDQVKKKWIIPLPPKETNNG